MEDIKVLAADIDNTIRVLGEEVQKKQIEAFQALHERGVLLGIASGRPLWQGVEQSAENWHLGFQFDFLIGLNGSVLKDEHTGRTEEFSFLTPADMEAIITQMIRHDPSCNPFIYGEGCEIVRKADEKTLFFADRNHTPVHEVKDISEIWEKPAAKILFRSDTEEQCARAEAFARTITTDRYTCFRTTPTMLEFQSPSINKGIALARYCEEQHIDMKEAWAFGDAENDIQMIRMAGHGICMKNGLEPVKAVSDDVTEYTCAEDGFGRYIFDHIL